MNVLVLCKRLSECDNLFEQVVNNLNDVFIAI